LLCAFRHLHLQLCPKNITLLIRSSSFIHHHKFVHIYGRAVGTASLPHPVSAPLFFYLYIYIFLEEFQEKSKKGKSERKKTTERTKYNQKKKGLFLRSRKSLVLRVVDFPVR